MNPLWLMALAMITGAPLAAHGEVLEVATSQDTYSYPWDEPTPEQAANLEVATSQDTYSYGDFLSFTVTVEKVTQDTASFKITDQDGVAGSSVSMKILNTTTMVTAPNPLTPVPYKEGTYTISVEYDGVTAHAEFQLVDSGIIAIPPWIKDVARLWLDGIIDDTAYLKNLADNGVILLERAPGGDEVASIPTVAEISSAAWIQGLISDHEYSLGMQYLTDKNVITVGG